MHVYVVQTAKRGKVRHRKMLGMGHMLSRRTTAEVEVSQKTGSACSWQHPRQNTFPFCAVLSASGRVVELSSQPNPTELPQAAIFQRAWRGGWPPIGCMKFKDETVLLV